MKHFLKGKIYPVMKIMLFVTGFLLSSIPAFSVEVADTATTVKRESLFPHKSISLATSYFTWGAEAGASIDLTGHDMSTIDVDVHLGYKDAFLQILGIGAGIHRTVQSGANFIPLYVMLQTSFRSKPSLFFLNAKLGYSFNTINDSPTFGDFVSSLGLGINLSRTRLARTYLVLALGYRYFNERHREYVNHLDAKYVYIAQLSFGVSF